MAAPTGRRVPEQVRGRRRQAVRRALVLRQPRRHLQQVGLVEEAGITTPPKTRDEFFKDLDAVKAKGKAEPIYLPGQNWYSFDGLLIGKGADLVKKDGDKWVSNLADPKVGEAMALYKKYADYSRRPRTRTRPPRSRPTSSPRATSARSSAWAGRPPPPSRRTRPSRRTIGYFTIPGETADKPEGVFLGGSNLAVAEGSKNKELAKEFLKIALSDTFEGQLAKEGGVIPNKEALQSNLKGNAAAEAAAPAVKGGDTTPLIPEWAAVENDPNPIKTYMTAVMNGKSHADAARQVEAEFNKRLAQKQ